jgi:hypothetical protein
MLVMIMVQLTIGLILVGFSSPRGSMSVLVGGGGLIYVWPFSGL